MRYSLSAAALALYSASLAVAQECPDGFQPVKKLTWENCGLKSAKGKNTPYVEKLECSTIEVPKDYTNRDSPILELRLIRQPATTGDKDKAIHVVINPGGPGESGFKQMIDGGGNNVQNQIGGKYGVVGFDPRGVGFTLTAQCADPDIEWDTNDPDGEVKAYIAAANQCKAADPNMPFFNTPFVARDVKAVSEALNTDGLIRYIGYSYGTVVGGTIAAMFPDRISRLVLDGNANVNDYYNTRDLDGILDFDKTFDRFFMLCAEAGPNLPGSAADPDLLRCGITDGTKTWQQLKATYVTFRNDLPNVPADQKVNKRAQLDGETFKAMYFAQNLRPYSQTLKGYYDTGTLPPPKKTTKRDLGYTPADYNTFSYPNALTQIACPDNVLQNTATTPIFAQIRSDLEGKSIFASNPYSGNPLNCAAWTTRAAEIFQKTLDPTQQIETAYSLLVLNTIYDPVTPLDSAQKNAAFFKDSILISTTEFGHCTGGQFATGLDQAISTYFNGAKPPSGQLQAAPGTNPFVTGGAPPPTNEDNQVDPGNQPGTPNARRRRDLFNDEINQLDRMFQRRALTKTKRLEAATTTTSSGAAASTTYPPGCTPDPYVKKGASTTTTTTMSSTTSTSTMSGTTSSTTTTTTVTGSTSSSSSTSTDSSTSSTSTTGTVSGSSSTSTTSGTSTTSTSSGTSTTGTVSGTSSTTGTSSATSTTGTASTTSTTGTVSGTSSTTGTSSGTSTTGTASVTSTTGTSSGSSTTGTVSGTSSTTTKSGSATQTQTGTQTGTASGSTKTTTATGTPYGTWSDWSMAGTTTKKPAVSTWAQWQTTTSKKVDPASWSQWSAAPTTTKKPDPATWAQWNTEWADYKSQTGVVPYTKAVTKDGKTVTKTYAVPTTTIYVDYVQDVCPTGLYTKTITVTATCNQGCYAKPTGVPQGYQTTTVYCSACASPQVVTVTVQVTQTVQVSTWADYASPSTMVKSTVAQTWSTWNGAQPASTWSDATKPTATGTGQWSGWQPSATGNVAKYTGAAVANAVPAVAGLVPALFAVFML